MKSLLLVLSLFVAGISFAAENVIPVEGEMIKPEEAKNYVGKNVEVRGLCVAVNEVNGNVYVNFVKNFPNQPFYAFVPGRYVAKVNRGSALQGLEGKTCSVSGVIELYKGRPQIVVTDGKQISAGE